MDIRVDTSQLRRLVADLSGAGPGLYKAVEPVVKRAGVNIKRDWRRAWSGHPHLTGLPPAIGFDLDRGALGFHLTTGVDKGKAQGPLGNLPEFGSVNNAPLPGGLPALLRELPRLERNLGKVVAEEIADG